jgi:hypothetical protein
MLSLEDRSLCEAVEDGGVVLSRDIVIKLLERLQHLYDVVDAQNKTIELLEDKLEEKES